MFTFHAIENYLLYLQKKKRKQKTIILDIVNFGRCNGPNRTHKVNAIGTCFAFLMCESIFFVQVAKKGTMQTATIQFNYIYFIQWTGRRVPCSSGSTHHKH